MDASPEELISKLEDMVECVICLDKFEDPRSLPCQHSFCKMCLEGMSGPERKIRCPCCNGEFPVLNGVQELPVDFRANSWLEIMSEYEKAKAAREAEAAEAAMQEASGLTAGDEPCPICEQITTGSKNLSCGHHLCANCVQFLLPVGGDTLHCPTCSSQTVILPTQPSTSALRTQPDYPSENEPLYQTLFELLGGRPQTAGGRSQRAQPSAPPGMFCERPHIAIPPPRYENTPAESRLTFHPRCGNNAVVLQDQVMAYRKNPMVWGEAVVLTSQQLRQNEVFEVRLDKRAVGWSGSLQIGVTTHSPVEQDFPTALHNLRTGTWYMTGSRIRHNNLTTTEEYGQDLNLLEAGNRVGVQRRGDGSLHFYINGVDQGIAASFVPAAVYGIIDMFGKTEHVTIIPHQVDPASTPTPPAVTSTPRSLYPDLTAVSVMPQQVSVTPQQASVTPQQVSVTPQQASVTPQQASVTPRQITVTPQQVSVTAQVSATPQAVEGMSMPQMLSMLELLTTAVAKAEKENTPESIYSTPHIPRFPLTPCTENPPAPRLPARSAPVCPPRSAQSEQEKPPPVPNTPRPCALNRQRPQERPPSPPTTPRPKLPNPRATTPRGPPPLPPSPGSPCPTQVPGRGPPPPQPASRRKPVFPPSTDETSAVPALLGSTASPSEQPQEDTLTGNHVSQDVFASARSDVPQQGLRVSLTDVLNRKSSLKKTAKQ